MGEISLGSQKCVYRPSGTYRWCIPSLRGCIFSMYVWLVIFDYFRHYSIVFLLVTIKITSFIQKQSKSTKISTKLENHRIMSKNHQKTKHPHRTFLTGFWWFFDDFLIHVTKLVKIFVENIIILEFLTQLFWLINQVIQRFNPLHLHTRYRQYFRPMSESTNIRKQVSKPLHTLHLTIKLLILYRNNRNPPKKIHKTQKSSNNKHENDDFNLKISNFDQFCKPWDDLNVENDTTNVYRFSIFKTPYN